MKIKISGVIGWDIYPEEVEALLEQATGDIDVYINSIGGYVSDGIMIHNMLNEYNKGKVNIYIIQAYSIASYISTAGDKRYTYDNAMFMIHNAWNEVGGDHHKQRKNADHLEEVSAMIAEKYATITGKSIDELKQLMNDETYFYGDGIFDAGFADEVISTERDKDETAALAKAKNEFALLSKKLKPKQCDDADKTCTLLNLGNMKQFENKPKNQFQEEKMNDLEKRLKALEAKAERTEDENTEMARLKAQIKKEQELEDLKKEKAELSRVNDVNNIAMKYNQTNNELHAKYKKEGTADDFVRDILDTQMKNQNPVVKVGDTQFHNQDQMMMAMADGLAMRSGAKISNPHADASMFQNASLLAIARKLTGAGEFEPAANVAHKLLAQGTSDFPILLSNVANKVLENAWEEEPTTYQHWCGEGDVPDFKENTFAHVGGFGNLQKLYEKGELKRGQIKESSEKGQIGSKGLIVGLSREAIINDDLGAFTRVIENLTQSGRRTLNADVYSVLTGTYKMSDNVALFHSTHKNLAASGTAITDDALTAGELAMMGQKGISGEPLNLSPYFMITGPSKYREGKQILSNTSVPGADNNSGVVNTWQGELTQIKDGNITGNEWFLVGRNNTVKVLFLAGTGRRPIVEMSNIGIAGVEYTIVFDYGVMVDNYRTLYKNPGN